MNNNFIKKNCGLKLYTEQFFYCLNIEFLL